MSNYELEIKQRKKEYNKEYYKKNKEKEKERKRKYNQKPEVKEANKRRQKKYRDTNHGKQKSKRYNRLSRVKEKQRERNKKLGRKVWQILYNQKEKVKKRKRISNKKYCQKSEVRIRRRLRRLLLYALNQYSQTGKIQSSSKYGIDYKAIIEHLKPFPEDLSNYEIHHIVPLHYFNLEDLEQIKIAFSPENHILLTIEQHKQIHKIFGEYNGF